MDKNILDLLWSVGAALSLGFTVYGAFPSGRALSIPHTVRPCAS
jgi:hypothetical protein